MKKRIVGYICSVCGKIFKEKASMSAHIGHYKGRNKHELPDHSEAEAVPLVPLEIREEQEQKILSLLQELVEDKK